jgi:hypothetical protein
VPRHAQPCQSWLRPRQPQAGSNCGKHDTCASFPLTWYSRQAGKSGPEFGTDRMIFVSSVARSGGQWVLFRRNARLASTGYGLLGRFSKIADDLLGIASAAAELVKITPPATAATAQRVGADRLFGRPGKQPLLLLLLSRPAFAEGPPPDLASLRPLITLAHAPTPVTSNRRRRCNTDGPAVPSGGTPLLKADPPR